MRERPYPELPEALHLLTPRQAEEQHENVTRRLLGRILKILGAKGCRLTKEPKGPRPVHPLPNVPLDHYVSEIEIRPGVDREKIQQIRRAVEEEERRIQSGFKKRLKLQMNLSSHALARSPYFNNPSEPDPAMENLRAEELTENGASIVNGVHLLELMHTGPHDGNRHQGVAYYTPTGTSATYREEGKPPVRVRKVGNKQVEQRPRLFVQIISGTLSEEKQALKGHTPRKLP